MAINRYGYSPYKNISAIVADPVSPAVWVAFAQGTDGKCVLEKEFPFQPDQSYYTLTRSVDAIVGLAVNSTSIFAAYTDDTLFLEGFSLSNPISTNQSVEFPVGVIESPIAVWADDNYVYALTPGTTSGENAKIIVYDTSLNYQETIDLSKSGLDITNAISLTVDDVGDIWVAVYSSPAAIVRVFTLSGGGWDFEQTEIV